MRAEIEELPARPRPEAAEGSGGGRRRGDTAGNCAAIGSPSCCPPQGSPRHPRAASSSIPATASCLSPAAPFHQKPPRFSGMLQLPMVWDASGSSLRLLSFPSDLALGLWGLANLGAGLVGFGGEQAVGGVLLPVTRVTAMTLRRVLGEGGRLHPP